MSEAQSARRQKVRQGTVVSDRMDKTVVVSVDRTISHPLYRKQVMRQKRYYAHDEANEYRQGDVVRIEETRPLSKLKRPNSKAKVRETSSKPSRKDRKLRLTFLVPN